MQLTSPKGKIAFKIAQKLQKQGYLAFFAGGCVRDSLMGEDPHDFDIATSAIPEEVEKLFEKTVPVGKQFGVILVLEEGIPFEVATFRTEGGYQDGRHPAHVQFSKPEEDAQRRDFTVNGLFYDPIKEEVLDYVGGVCDIRNRVIRAIGDPEKRFEEDKLRVLRGIRFASTLGFSIDAFTWQAILKYQGKLTQVSRERIRDELTKIFTRPGADRGLDLLSDSGILIQILPEVEAMKGVGQNPKYHPEGDVYVHTRKLLAQLKNPSVILAWGALLHDIAKPVTYDDSKGKITFYQHEARGVDMARDMMKRLKFSNEEIQGVSECIRQHLKFGDVQKMRAGKLKQFVSRKTFLEELELHRIDCLASHGMLDNYEFLKKKIQEYASEDLKPRPYVNGHDLLERGWVAGPRFKEVLEALYEMQLEGHFKSREEALQYLADMQ